MSRRRTAPHGSRRHLGRMLVAVGAALALLGGCLAREGASACQPGSPSCREWVVVLRQSADASVATRWLQAQGWAVGRVLADLQLVHVWLPQGAAGQAALQAIRAQPWARYVTDQARPVPSAGASGG